MAIQDGQCKTCHGTRSHQLGCPEVGRSLVALDAWGRNGGKHRNKGTKRARTRQASRRAHIAREGW